jgi:hypothetical protein
MAKAKKCCAKAFTKVNPNIDGVMLYLTTRKHYTHKKGITSAL